MLSWISCPSCWRKAARRWRQPGVIGQRTWRPRPRIARNVGCDDETVREIIKAFNARGVAILTPGSRRSHHTQAAFPAGKAEKLKELLHQSPRTYGKETGVWTLELAAEISFVQGLTAEQVSGETIRATLERLGVKWKRAKQWITSPDPAYARKKRDATT